MVNEVLVRDCTVCYRPTAVQHLFKMDGGIQRPQVVVYGPGKLSVRVATFESRRFVHQAEGRSCRVNCLAQQNVARHCGQKQTTEANAG